MVRGFQKEQKKAPPSQATHKGADAKRNNNNLDIVFLQDTTGSQGPYIKAATQAIRDICEKIAAASEISKDKIRFGLIAFRDHPPQDNTYVTKPFGFTSNIEVMQKNLSGLVATGGGDGPEAQTAALAAALDLNWAEDSIKMVVLITDSPPHGLGEAGDGFNESPDQNDPLEVARQMSEKGITLFVIACEPALSHWNRAVDFYTALAKITGGHIFPLLMADKLGDLIVGTALETIETEKLIKEFEKTIVKNVYENGTPLQQVANDLQGYIQSKGIQMNTVVMDNVYQQNPIAERNVNTWITSKDVKSGSSSVTPMTSSIAPMSTDVVEPRFNGDYSAERTIVGSGVGPRIRTNDAVGRKTEKKVWGPGSLLRRFWRVGKTEKQAPSVPHDWYHDWSTPHDWSMASPSEVPPAPRIPNFELASVPSFVCSPVSSAQAHRIVMQSVARSSNVTEEGMSSRSSGKVISSPLIYG